jgi:hypothetical protein
MIILTKVLLRIKELRKEGKKERRKDGGVGGTHSEEETSLWNLWVRDSRSSLFEKKKKPGMP